MKARGAALSFPLSYESFVPLPAHRSASGVIHALEREISRLGGKVAVNDPDCIQFSGRIFRFASSLNLLTFIRSGTIWLDRPKQAVRYRLNFSVELVLTTTLVLVAFGIPLHASPNLTRVRAIAIVCVMWAWLYGANYWFSVIRFHRRITSIVLNQLKGPLGLS